MKCHNCGMKPIIDSLWDIYSFQKGLACITDTITQQNMSSWVYYGSCICSNYDCRLSLTFTRLLQNHLFDTQVKYSCLSVEFINDKDSQLNQYNRITSDHLQTILINFEHRWVLGPDSSLINTIFHVRK